MDRRRGFKMIAWGEDVASFMERATAKVYAWMWGASIVLVLTWPFLSTEAFASLLRPLLMGAFGLLLVCSLAWVTGANLRYLGASSAKR